MPLVITIPKIHQERPKFIEKSYLPKAEDADYKQKFMEAGVYIRNKAVQAKCYASKYTVFHIQVDMSPTGGSSEILKRFQDFRNFDAVWRKLYPAVHDICQLPKRDLKSALLPNNEDVVKIRQKALEEYLQGLLKVTAVRSLLAQFLEVKEDDMKRALTEERARRATLTDHLRSRDRKQGDDAKALAPGAKVKILSAEEVKAMKGNNMEANNAALKAKQEFMEKHKGVLDALMPGRAYNMPMSLVKQEHKLLHLGQINLNVFYMVATTTLHVEIEEAKDLPAVSNLIGEPTTDSYVKVYLKPDADKLSKRKTKVVQKSLNPIFHEAFEYKIPQAELLSKELEIGVWGKGGASVGGVGSGVALGYVFMKGSSIQSVSGAVKPSAQIYQLAPPPEQEAVVVAGSTKEVKRSASPLPRAVSAGPASSPVSPSPPSRLGSSPSSSPSPSSPAFSYPSPAKSVGPPAAPAPVPAETKGRVVESYTPSAEEAESAIALTEGETVIVLDHADSVWWFGRDPKGKEGYFPADCVVIIQPAQEEES